ncbi:MAG: S-layer homology domain-containing protein [Clostridia bacterium]|nr:S-layer homology domain-containing protein [Clostridia bacterium]
MIVKKLIAAIMIFTMLMTCVQPCFAATINDTTDFVPNPLEMDLAVGVTARKSGTSDAYTSALSIEDVVGGVGVDYQATLNMKPIRDICTGAFITNVIGNDQSLKTEFDSAPVTTTVSVEIEYPSSASIGADLSTAGVLEAGSIFSEASPRSINGNKVTITYKNADSITARALVDNVNSYLADIIFTLNDAVTYSTDGYHTVSVKLTGETQIAFSSKVQKVQYTGEASHIVSALTMHVLEVVPAKPATCTDRGWTEGVKCKTHSSYNCGAHGLIEPQNTIAPLGHTTSFIAETPATCTTDGVKAHYVCLVCKKDFKEASATTEMSAVDLKITAEGHKYTISVDAVSATCTKDGLSSGYICSVCNHATTRTVVPANGHTVVDITAVPATCTTDGATIGKKCLSCGVVLIAPVVVAATGHKYDDNWSETLAPTESSTGSKERVCTVCGQGKETVTIPKLEHTCAADPNASVVTKEATCTETGLLQKYCACGQPFGEAEVIAAKGHDTTHVVGKTATCTDKGIIDHYACKNCQGLYRDAECTKAVQSAEIPVDKTNHVDGRRTIPAVAATCDKDGLTAGEKCTGCNTITTPQTKIPKLSDNPEANYERVSYVAPTCEADGVIEHYHCSNCNKDYTIHELEVLDDCSIPKTGHHWGDVIIDTPSTETIKGEGHRVCTNNSDHTITVDIALKEHVHNEECEEIIKQPSCTEKGKKRVVYTCCGEIKNKEVNNGIIEIPAKGHNFKTIEKAPDCFRNGIKKHKYCAVCDKAFDFTTEVEITDLETLKTHKLTHKFGNWTDNKRECEYCHEIVHRKQENHNHNVKEHGGLKGEEGDIREKRADEEPNRDVKVESKITIEEREISEKLDNEVRKDEKAHEDKVVLEITVEKETKTTDTTTSNVLDIDREIVKETEDLIVIEIAVPAGMQDFVDFLVHRLHIDDQGAESFDVIKVAPNNDGEFIKLIKSGDKVEKIELHVKKFSEYAVIGYDKVVNVDPVTSSSGGGSTSYTVKLNVNGGVVLNNIVVKRGEKVTLPTPTRDGYVFAGWYTDSAFNTPFDANTAINRNYVLYAKWIEAGECEGTVEDNCPCLKYNDLDPELWYHEGVDYVLNTGMMIGTGDKTFEPDTSVTRAMLVTVLWRAEGKPEAAKDSSFKDLEDGLYYVDAVEWAAENGIVNGYTETEFAPNDKLAREQIAAIMFRYAGHKGYDVSVGENTNILSYTDYSQISEYAIPAMQWAAGSGLMTGRTNSTLNPKADTTRAEIATILYRFFSAR